MGGIGLREADIQAQAAAAGRLHRQRPVVANPAGLFEQMPIEQAAVVARFRVEPSLALPPVSEELLDRDASVAQHGVRRRQGAVVLRLDGVAAAIIHQPQDQKFIATACRAERAQIQTTSNGCAFHTFPWAKRPAHGCHRRLVAVGIVHAEPTEIEGARLHCRHAHPHSE